MPHPSAPTRFTSAQVCEAAGISASTLKNWVSREPQVVLLREEDRENERGGKGIPLTFSFNRVMQVALTAELVRFGWQPRAATLAAVAFTDLGDAAHGWAADGPPVLGRLPGQLYATGTTVLIATPGDDDEGPRGECLQMDADTPWSRIFRPSHASGQHTAVTVVDVSALWSRVRLRLGLPL
jgi:hypothetical protein